MLVALMHLLQVVRGGGCEKDGTDGYRLQLKGLEPPRTVDSVENSAADLE